MRHFLLLSIILGSFFHIQAKNTSDAELIQSQYEKMNVLFDEDKFEECVKLFDDETLNYFKGIEQHALYSTMEEISELKPVDLMMALTVRAFIIEAELDIDSTENVGLASLLKGNKEEIRPPSSLINIEIHGDWAHALVMLGDKETDDSKIFHKEDDVWKLNMTTDIENAKAHESLIALHYGSKEKMLTGIAETLAMPSSVLFTPILEK